MFESQYNDEMEAEVKRLELLGCVGPEEKVDDFLAHSEMKTTLQQLLQKHEKIECRQKKEVSNND